MYSAKFSSGGGGWDLGGSGGPLGRRGPPPITAEAFDPTLLGLLRGAALALLTIDLGEAAGIEGAQQIVECLQQTKTRLATESYLDLADLGVSYTQTLAVLAYTSKSDQHCQC